MYKKSWLSLPIALAVAGMAYAAPGDKPETVLDGLIKKSSIKAYLTQSPQNIMMLPDNPAWDVVEAGEALHAGVDPEFAAHGV